MRLGGSGASVHRPGMLPGESCLILGSEGADGGCVPEPAGSWLRSPRARAVGCWCGFPTFGEALLMDSALQQAYRC